MKCLKIIFLGMIGFSSVHAASDDAVFNKVLENVRKDAVNAPPPIKVANPPSHNRRPYRPSLPLSLMESDDIRTQIEACWNPPAPIKGEALISARIRIELARDGSVVSATPILDRQNYDRKDVYFKALIDSAIRASMKCGPIKNLFPEKYESWHVMEMVFDPKDL